VIAQAGVGGLASALCARFWIEWGPRRPRFVTLEPTKAACVMASLRAGRQTALSGDIDTAMAGLSCGEVSDLAWEVLATGADAALALSDDWAFAGMRRLADPEPPDPPIVGGECAGGAVGALMALADRPAERAALGMDSTSRVLLIGTEGATDAAIYAKAVGRAPQEVTDGA
jgi:diaminopropionate ammonia-lyase